MWGYTATNGPATWPELFPQANGQRQSPINILTSNTQKGSDLKAKPLKWQYVPENTRSMINSGYGWRVDVVGTGSELVGGPLKDDVYVLEQFHCHWGCSDNTGSEHTVDGVAYAGELHLVHWNKSRYGSFAEAVGHSDGLAVLGVFLKVGEHHAELETMAKLLPFIAHKGDRVTMTSPLDPAKLLPENVGYWTYLGSLTTPPCNESVIWIVFKNPIEVSSIQIQRFRDLRNHDVMEELDCPCDVACEVACNAGKIVNNYRPPLPLENREIREFGEH